VFAFSSLVPLEQIDQEHPYEIRLIPLAGKSYDRWTAWLTTHAQTSPLKSIKNLLHEYFPERLAIALLEQADLDPLMPAGQISKILKSQFGRMMGE
jgi:predicted flavoprotein YhiN